MISTIKQNLKQWFDFPANKTYCQVSTLADNKPRIRTMRLYQVTDEGNLILLTDTRTKKWKELSASPRLAICLLNSDRGQILVEGNASLNTYSTDKEMTAYCWTQFLDQYWRDYYLSLENSDAEIPSCFGVIIVQPDSWEILELNKQDFLQGKRVQYQIKAGNWEIQEVAVS